MDYERLKKLQIELSKQVIVKDEFRKVEKISGVDVRRVNESIITAAVLLNKENLRLIDKKVISKKTKSKYDSGFRCFSDGSYMIEALNRLSEKPDLIFVSGQGILHPRLGLASYVGLQLEIPSIGVASSLLVGDMIDNRILIDKEVKGLAVITKENSKPLYVSPGHKISLFSAVDFVKKFVVKGHKLPEPLHLARRFVRK